QLLVQQDRADPENRQVQRLSYAILKARDAAPAADPIVFLTGGPGSSAFYFLPVIANSPLRQRRDIIVVEQRGNGYSSPNLLCNPGEPATPEAVLAGFRACRAEIDRRGVPVQPYDTTQSAADVAELRVALGIREWNVFGTSYGSFWALRTLADHPDGIRTVILDSPFPPQATDKDEWVAQLNGLDAVFVACAADVDCDRAYPQLRQRYIALLEALDRTPVTGARGSFGAADVHRLVGNVNFETVTVHLVPRLIAALEQQDLADVERISGLSGYPRARGIDMRRVYSAGLNVNIPCIDDIPFDPPAEDRLTLLSQWPDTVTRVVREVAMDKERICREVWPVRPAGRNMGAPVASDVPALITVGAMDPSTPPALGEQMARTLPNATLAILPDSVHAALVRPSACVAAILRDFLDQPGQRPETGCLEQDRPRFALPGEPI
ncbi:MAG: alpha/beta fold hydrolase, partial [Thermaurantiacus sp.]